MNDEDIDHSGFPAIKDKDQISLDQATFFTPQEPLFFSY